MEQRKNNKRILLHACCAICSGYPIEALRELGYEPVVYFYNPNIYPVAEYQKRLAAQREICLHYGVELIEGSYEPEIFFEAAKGLENEPERGKRCIKCFELRLINSIHKARELGIETLTTSIVISPHKNFQLISDIGQKLCENENIEYLAIDFKKKDGFLKTNNISKSLGLYRQNYCGCKFTIRQA